MSKVVYQSEVGCMPNSIYIPTCRSVLISDNDAVNENKNEIEHEFINTITYTITNTIEHNPYQKQTQRLNIHRRTFYIVHCTFK